MVLHRRAAALGVQCRAELPVGDCVLPKADERPQQADDPEALCFHHDAVHRLLPDHAAGHLGQRTDRHVVLEQQVQVRRALAGAALEQGALRCFPLNIPFVPAISFSTLASCCSL